MQRRSPLTDPTTVAQIDYAQNWQQGSELWLNAGYMGFFIRWLSKGAESVWNMGLKYINLPITMAAAFFQAVFAIREAHLRKDGHSITNAVVQVVTGAALIIGGIAVAASIATFAVAGPILLAAAIAGKSLFSLGSAFYFAIKASLEKNEGLKNVYKKNAREHLVDGLIGSVITAAAAAIILVAAPVVQTVLASLAIAATAVGMIHYIIKDVSRKPRLNAESEAMHAKTSERSTTADLGIFFGNRTHHQPCVDEKNPDPKQDSAPDAMPQPGVDQENEETASPAPRPGSPYNSYD